LADALDSSQWLSERILLDVSGRQLAETLVALDLLETDSLFMLEKIYPHLVEGGAQLLLAAVDAAEAIDRVESWQRADSYTNGGGTPKAANGDREASGDAHTARQRAAG